jgi:hypothetical protein
MQSVRILHAVDRIQNGIGGLEVGMTQVDLHKNVEGILKN